jgi:hypothetical protein
MQLGKASSSKLPNAVGTVVDFFLAAFPFLRPVRMRTQDGLGCIKYGSGSGSSMLARMTRSTACLAACM